MADPDIRIHIIGVGSDGLAGLTSRARELLQNADVLLGSEQALAALPELRAERVRLGSDLSEAPAASRAVTMATNGWCWSRLGIPSFMASHAIFAIDSARTASRWCRM